MCYVTFPIFFQDQKTANASRTQGRSKFLSLTPPPSVAAASPASLRPSPRPRQ